MRYVAEDSPTTRSVQLRPWLSVVIVIISIFGGSSCGHREPTGKSKPIFDHWENIVGWPVPTKPLSEKLRILIWRDYLDPRILSFFQTRYNIRLEIVYFENNPELKKIFKNEPTGFDILMPSDFVVEGYLKNIVDPLLAPIRRENVPNLAHVKKSFFRLQYDPELVYSVPIFYSVLGIGFNNKTVQHLPRDFTLRTSNSEENLMLFGYRAILNEPRVSLSAALIDDGVDPNSPTPETLALTANRLANDVGTLGIRFLADSLPNDMVDEKIKIALCWSGAAAAASRKNSNIRFILPKGQKKLYQIDSFVIPATSTRKYTAEFFINFLLIPEISGALTNYSVYANSNADSTPFILRDILQGPAYMEPPSDSRLFLADLGELESEFERAWLQIKQKNPTVKIKVPYRAEVRIEK